MFWCLSRIQFVQKHVSQSPSPSLGWGFTGQGSAGWQLQVWQAHLTFPLLPRLSDPSHPVCSINRKLTLGNTILKKMEREHFCNSSNSWSSSTCQRNATTPEGGGGTLLLLAGTTSPRSCVTSWNRIYTWTWTLHTCHSKSRVSQLCVSLLPAYLF